MAELFDGVSSDPISVEPSLSELGLAFGGRTIPWSRIQGIQKVAGAYRIELGDHGVLVVDDESLAMELDRRLHAGKTGFARWSHRWSALPLWKQVVFGALVGGAFAGALYAGFLQLYRFAPLRYDRHIGDKIHTQAMELFDTCASPRLVEFARKASVALSAPGDRFRHRVVVVDDSMVNAFALPGGNIYLFRGILESSESPDEILGVVAHEIAHVELRHGVQQLGRTMGLAFLSSMVIGADVEGLEMADNLETLSEIGSTLLVLKYSRGFEREADLEGLRRLRRAGLPAMGLGRLLVRIETRHESDSALGWLSTHPTAMERLRRYERELARIPDPPRPDPRFDAERADWDRIKRSCPEQPRDWKRRIKLPW